MLVKQYKNIFTQEIHFFLLISPILSQPEMEKTYKRASNACVNFFIVWVKSVTKSTLFCRESELCCDFALLGVILMAFNLVSFNFYFKKRNK